MAEGGRPVSELYPPGGAVSSDSALSTKPLLPTSNSSVEVLTSSKNTHLPEGPGHICQEATSETSKEHPASCLTRETDNISQRASGEPGEQVAGQPLQLIVSGHPPEHCALPRFSVHPHSIAGPYTSSHQHEEVLSVTNHSPQAGRRMVQRLQPASLPVQRSHSDTLPLVKQGTVSQPPQSETCGRAYHGGDYNIQEGQGHSSMLLACKQPMQLQHCNIVTTTCRGANSGRDSPTRQPQGGCLHICAPRAANTMEDVGSAGEGHHHPQCEEALYYGSYIHHSNLEDTFSAYCHPQPIPAPAQLLPRLAGMEAGCRVKRAVPPHSTTNLLTLPRLISSVSETGLDAKRLLGCCNLNCSWISSFPPGGGPQTPQRGGGDECCSSPSRSTTRDMGTMTAHKELKDVGVQTSQTASVAGPLRLPPHVFPQICLVEENRNKTTGNQSTTTEADGGGRRGGAQKSPVKEVKWDAEGMTWEVYGASVDPEELGLAIQKHLELQIKETAGHAAKLSRQDTNTSRQSGDTSCHRKRSRMMGSIRPCCTRTTTAVD